MNKLLIVLALSLLLIHSASAWSLSGYTNCRNVTVWQPSYLASGVNVPIRANLTGLTKLANNNDVRIVDQACGLVGNEIPRDVLTSGVNSAFVLFLANYTAGVNTTYSVYYNNPGASAPSYATDLVTSSFTDQSQRSEFFNNSFIHVGIPETSGPVWYFSYVGNSFALNWNPRSDGVATEGINAYKVNGVDTFKGGASSPCYRTFNGSVMLELTCNATGTNRSVYYFYAYNPFFENVIKGEGTYLAMDFEVNPEGATGSAPKVYFDNTSITVSASWTPTAFSQGWFAVGKNSAPNYYLWRAWNETGRVYTKTVMSYYQTGARLEPWTNSVDTAQFILGAGGEFHNYYGVSSSTNNTNNWYLYAKNQLTALNGSEVNYTPEIDNVTNTTYPLVAYETVSKNYSISFRNGSGVSDVNAYLIWNGLNYSPTGKLYVNGNYTFNYSVAAPLQASNNSVSMFFWNISVTFSNGTTAFMNSTNITQNLWFAYAPLDVSFYQTNYSEDELVYPGLVVLDVGSNASLAAYFNESYSNSTLAYSTSTTSYGSSGSNKTFTVSMLSGLNSVSSENRTIRAVVQVTAGGLTYNRTVLNRTIYVMQLVFTNCSAGSVSVTPALISFLLDEANDNPVYNGTIQMNVYGKAWNSSYYRSSNVTWNLTGLNSNNASLCLFPNTTTAYASIQTVYSALNYVQRNYYAFGNLSNVVSALTLYLLQTASADELDITLQDEAGTGITGYIIQAQRYFAGSNSYKVVAQAVSDYQGKAKMFLEPGADSYKFVIEDSAGNFVKSFTPVVINSQLLIATGVYAITFKIAPDQSSDVAQNSQVAAACAFDNGTSTLTCVVTDPTQLSASSQLLVQQSVGFSFITICSAQATTATATLSCPVISWNNTYFRYTLTLYNRDGTQFLAAVGSFDYRQNTRDYGDSGVIITLLIVVTAFFLGAWNPAVALFLAGGGMIVAFLLGAFNVGVGTLIGFLVIILIFAWKGRG